MANTKKGFSYYNVDTDRYQDMRIKRLKKTFGCIGIAVYDYILCEIYRVRGCFIEWDKSTAFDVAEYFDLKETQIDEVISYCCAVGLFDKELLASGSVLSSAAIQTRYVEMSMRSKRKDFKIPEECRIIQEECAKIQEESPKLTEVCRKVNKRNININIDSDNTNLSSPDIKINISKKEKKEQTKVCKKEKQEADASFAPAGAGERINYQKLFDYFNSQFTGKLPNVRELTEKRKQAIKARIAAHGKEAVMSVFANIHKSPFLIGENDKNWRADFDWIFCPSNFVKILEGNYLKQESNVQKQAKRLNITDFDNSTKYDEF